MRMTVLILCLVGIVLYANATSLLGIRYQMGAAKQEAIGKICPPSNGSWPCHVLVQLLY